MRVKAIILTCFFMASSAIGDTYIIDQNGFKDFTTIQAAIDDANNGDQIEVAPGTYNEAIDFLGKTIRLYSRSGPDVTTIDANGIAGAYHVVQCVSGEDANTILEGFTITGGYANGTDPNDKYGAGMYNNNSSPTVTNCTFRNNWAYYRGGGIYNFLSNPNMTSCNFSSNSSEQGGGMYNNYYSNPTLINCTFINNSANNYGGGMSNLGLSNPTMTKCTFINNTTDHGGGGIYNNCSSPNVKDCAFTGNSANELGGGICNQHYSSTIVTNCTFSDNTAYAGGGLYNSSSKPNVTGCTFSNNTASYRGGGITILDNIQVLNNCNFVHNTASIGGGMYISSNQVVTNCTFISNSAGIGGGICIHCIGLTMTNCTIVNNNAPYGPAIADECFIYIPHTVIMVNCIIWNGISWMWYYEQLTTEITYSDVHGGYIGTGNIDADPCFANPGYLEDPCNTPGNPDDDIWIDGDYHLQSEAGRWNPNSQSWVIDANTSPCIDAGDWMTPVGLEPFPNGGRVNMGAYGGTVEASKSYFGSEPCETIVAGDINGDCKVDFKDFAIMSLHWLECNLDPPSACWE